MKAISMWQPWASLWLTESKVHETRSWATNYRGTLLVHAAKKFVRGEGVLGKPLIEILGGHWGIDLPLGAIIGEVELVDCYPTEYLHERHSMAEDYQCGDFSAGRYAWKRSTFKLYKRPLPWRGAQRIFNVNEEHLKALAR